MPRQSLMACPERRPCSRESAIYCRGPLPLREMTSSTVALRRHRGRAKQDLAFGLRCFSGALAAVAGRFAEAKEALKQILWCRKQALQIAQIIDLAPGLSTGFLSDMLRGRASATAIKSQNARGSDSAQTAGKVGAAAGARL